MSEAAGEPSLFIVRHGATEWSENGRHTSSTDLPLLPEGRKRATALREVLDPGAFGRVLCSPLLRARETCQLAGFGERMEIVPELTEWDYGEYEGLTSVEIHQRDPSWSLWTDGCPGGESPAQVTARVERVIELAVSGGADALPPIAFAHGHILRALSGCWIGLGACGGERFALAPAGIAKLGHEHTTRVIERWNVSAL